MAGGGGDGEEADYWPGYVDALTAMVKVLAFVMMLLAVAVFVLSQNTSREMVQQVADAAGVTPKEGATPSEVIEQVRQKILSDKTAPPKPPPQSSQQPVPETRVDSKASDTFVEQTAVEAVASGSRFVVTFPDRVTRVDPEAVSKLGGFVKPMSGSGRKFTIIAYADLSASALTEARRIAYFRAMQLRGQILASGFPAESLAIQVQDVNDSARGRVAEVVVQ
jgi:hypothetical protein